MALHNQYSLVEKLFPKGVWVNSSDTDIVVYWEINECQIAEDRDFFTFDLEVTDQGGSG